MTDLGVRPLQLIVLVFALQLGVVTAWAGPNTSRPGLRVSRNPSASTVLRRPFDASKKQPLPESWTIGEDTYVSRKEYADLKGGVMELLRRYPPDKYFFVGLGRDPAPVIAFLQNLGEHKLAVNLPGTSNVQWAKVGLRPADVARHIEAAIPNDILEGDRQIVLLDVTSSGKTPALFGPFMDRYFANRGIHKTALRLAFSWTNVKQKKFGPLLSDWIDTGGWRDFSRYITGKYEGNWQPGIVGTWGIAEHEKHSMTPDAEPPTLTNPNYASFRQAVMARMEQDQELDAFLRDTIGVRSQAEETSNARKVEMAVERHKRAQEIVALRKYPTRMKQSALKLVAGLPQRTDSHSKGPYLSENGQAINAWLMDSLTERVQADQVSAAVRGAGPNLVTRPFIEETLEDALRDNKIRNRDYRRLLGHALGRSVMNDEMLESLTRHFKDSAAMQRELTGNSEFYLEGSKHQPAGTENMRANYKKLMAKIAAERPAP
jgi:hypothetical protein